MANSNRGLQSEVPCHREESSERSRLQQQQALDMGGSKDPGNLPGCVGRDQGLLRWAKGACAVQGLEFVLCLGTP